MSTQALSISYVFCSHRMICRLIWYPPSYAQAWHGHSTAQVSFLLSGGFSEYVGRDRCCIARNSVAVKPRGAEHAVRFGPDGALILAFDLNDDSCAAELALSNPGKPWLWRDRVRTEILVGAVVRHLSDSFSSTALDVEDAFWGVVLPLGASKESSVRGVPPAWLVKIKQSIDDTPSKVLVGSAADDAGVHRTHLTRVFSRHFGVSISAYRRRAMVGLAIKQLMNGDTPVGSSNSAGFADQSHMTRAVKDFTGFTPGLLRRLLYQSGMSA